MKNFLISFSCLMLTILVSAQQEINTNFATQINTLFSTLDKTKVPHGILLDYGMEFTNVPAFNGTLTDSTYTNKTVFRQLYNTLFMSRIQSSANGFVSPNVREKLWNNERSSNFIALSGLYFKYSKFLENANTTGKLTYSNGKFYDVYRRGVWQNPYQEFKTFVISPPISKYQGLNLKVKIPQTIFYSNYSAEIQKIEIDFQDGLGYRLASYNQIVNVNYRSEGLKNWKYKLTLTNGQTMLSHSQINIEKGIDTTDTFNNINQPYGAGPETTDGIYGKVTITGEIPYLGKTASTTVLIDYASSDRKIRKPLIVAEGFDTGTFYNPENIYGDASIKSFKNSIENNTFGTVLYNLLIQNSTQQYDIIYVNWNNGTDYLQRNAYALEEVIKWVNQQKALNGSTQQNVVLGQSMGGVISRFILRDMEQRGIPHQTRLFVSQDAPQQGANIPLSLQYMFRHITSLYNQVPTPFNGVIENISDLDLSYLDNSILDTPAAKQLLSIWTDKFSNINNTEFETFFNTLRTKGYPTLSRNVAISNGAECGTNQNFNVGENLASYYTSVRLSFLQDLASLIVLPIGGSLATLITANLNFGSIGLLGLIPGNSRFSTDFYAKALSYTASNQIYKGKVSYTKRILWIGPKITVNITNINKYQPNGLLPYDNYGGGYYNTKVLTNNASLPSGIYIRDRFNFIPTTSALDIGGRNIALNDVDYKSAYVGATPPIAPKNSPFSNFVTEFEPSSPNAHNKPHISFNTRNGNWLASELNNNPIQSNCSFICNSNISGSGEILCNTETYFAPSGADYYNWSINQNPANIVSYTTSNNSITITRLGNSIGDITIGVNYGSANCGSTSIGISILVGKKLQPNIAFSSELIDHDYGTNYRYAYVYRPIETTEYYEEYSSDGVNYSAFPIATTMNANGPGYMVPEGSGMYCIYVRRVINNCVIDLGQICTPQNSYRNVAQSSNYIISPNPANNFLNIELTNKSTDTFESSLFNISGISVGSSKSINGKSTINTQRIPNGIYTLVLIKNGVKESKQIEIKH